jgi:hypothetical protein
LSFFVSLSDTALSGVPKATPWVKALALGAGAGAGAGAAAWLASVSCAGASLNLNVNDAGLNIMGLGSRMGLLGIGLGEGDGPLEGVKKAGFRSRAMSDDGVCMIGEEEKSAANKL